MTGVTKEIARKRSLGERKAEVGKMIKRNWKQDERPARFGWAPGAYIGKCRECGEGFIGDKRAMICADCAYEKLDLRPKPERYVSPHPKPDAFQSEILDNLAAECAEVIQRIEKLKRFGAAEIQKGQDKTNAWRLGDELGNVFQVYAWARQLGLVDQAGVEHGADSKRNGFRNYLQNDPPAGWEW